MRENFKRYWLIGVGGFVAYLIGIIIPLVINHGDAYCYQALFQETYLPTLALAVVVPVITAFILWQFVSNQSGTAFMHTLPYSRKQIFHSNNLCGAVLIAAPILITGVILLIIRAVSGPVMMEDAISGPGGVLTTFDVMPFMEIFKWTVFVLVINLAIYAIAVASAMLTGISLLQPVITWGFLALGPVCVFLIDLMNECMLYGYWSELKNTLVQLLSPVMTMDVGSQQGMKFMLVWLVAGIAIYFLAAFLYRIKKMERCGDVLVFAPTRPVVKYLISMMAAVMGGLAFYYLIAIPKGIYFVMGALIWGLVAYIAIDMIIHKTVKIKGFVKGFGLLLVMMILFFGAYYIDIFGYETKVPDMQDIQGVQVSGLINGAYYDYITEDSEETEKMAYIKDEKNIGYAVGLHENLTETRNTAFKSQYDGEWYYLLDDGSITPDSQFKTIDFDNREILGEWDENGDDRVVSFKYILKNGKKITRTYTVPSAWLINNDKFNGLMQSDEYKKASYNILNWNEDEMEFISASVNPLFSYDGLLDIASELINDNEKVRELVKAIKTDMLALDTKQMFEGARSSGVSFTGITLRIKKPADSSIKYDGAAEEKLTYDYTATIDENYKTTIALLREWGAFHAPTAEDVNKAEVTKVERVKDGFVTTTSEVTDPAEIQRILDAGKEQISTGGNLYVANLYFKGMEYGMYITLYYE